jgi:arylsulfatase
MTPRESNAQADTQSEFEPDRRRVLLSTASLLAMSAVNRAAAQTPPSPPGEKLGPPAPPPAAAGGKPNILVIWGDDIGLANISAYSHGLMGYRRTSTAWPAKE